MQTLRQMARGLTYSQAAGESHRSPSTVRSLLHTAYKRLGVSTISQALAVCTAAGWLDEVPQDGAAVEFADNRVTWAQRLYLEAFEQSLRAREDPDEVTRTRMLRRAALTGVYNEARKEQPRRRFSSDPLGRLLRDTSQLGLQ
jgi:DNA-binding CsgD family transcriptional regulator